jgi:protein phosphatase
MKVRVGASTDVGRARERNEDAYLSSPPLYAVADGLGGHRGGDVASSLALHVLEEIAKPGMWGQLSEQIREANRAILEQARGDRSLAGMGTTITAAFMDEDELHLAHVGDSRAYLLRAGEFSPLTEDHTLVHRMVQEGKISPEEAEHHPQRNIVVRALGVDDPVEVDEITIPVQKGDRVLLCSDGLYSMVPDERIQEALQASGDPQEASVRLVDLANDAGGLDNITVVVLDFDEGDGAEVLASGRGVEQQDAAEAPASGPEPSSRPARGRRLAYWGIAAVAVLALALVGFRLFLDSRWFVGEHQGHVAVYRGLPVTLFGSFHLFGLVREFPGLSAKKTERLAAFRDLKDGHTADTEQSALRIVDTIRRQLAEQRSGTRSA